MPRVLMASLLAVRLESSRTNMTKIIVSPNDEETTHLRKLAHATKEDLGSDHH
jgi:hypothetical protein